MVAGGRNSSGLHNRNVAPRAGLRPHKLDFSYATAAAFLTDKAAEGYNSIAAEDGDLYYDTTDTCWKYHDGTAWRQMGHQSVLLSTNVRVNERTDDDVTFTLSAGSEGAFTASGLEGVGTITIQGAWTEATGITGASSGTAGAGSSSTTLNKPAAASNWVAGALRGKFLVISSGGGSGAVRPIITNTTGAVTVHAITGMDATSVFEIADPGTTFSTITIDRCTPAIKFIACEVTRVLVTDSTEVQFNGLSCDDSNAAGSILVERGGKFTLDDSLLEGAASLIVNQAQQVHTEDTVLDTGTVKYVGCNKVTTEIDAADAASTPILFQRCPEVNCGAASSDNTGSGVQAEGCNYFTPSGTGLTGSGNSAYGLYLAGGGYYEATGATITGDTNDFFLSRSADTWANLATDESFGDLGTSIVIVT